jgi:tRNA A-37 threonylcarbamoyl transferase component Bud32
LKQEKSLVNNTLSCQILEFCRHIAGSSETTAIAYLDSYSIKDCNERQIQEVLLIIHDYQPRLMSYIKNVDEKAVFVFAVDQWVFERDIDRGFLGEAIASKLVFPYLALCGESYLHQREVDLKKRLVLETMENIALSFPELANRILIQPQYFLYEVLLNRMRVFPLLAYNLPDLMGFLIQNEDSALECYQIALRQLEREGKISYSNGFIVMSKKFVSQCQNPKRRLINLARNAPRTLFTSFLGIFPQLIKVVSQNTEAFVNTQRINWRIQSEPTCTFVDPQKFAFFSTSEGLVSLADKVDIRGFAQKMLLKDQSADIEIYAIGSMLNDVYLIKARGKNGERKVLAKRFRDWTGFKWFPLSLWSFGARAFAVASQDRLSRECVISEVLRQEGFDVPRILHVSNAERLVFMDFIDGKNLSEAIKRISVTERLDVLDDELAKVRKVGEIYAKVHARNITLGDTKPENVLIRKDGKVFLIDFEQAMEGGDKAWDLAVFLYYCGHYLQPFNSNSNGKAELITRAFIDGYLRGGGDSKVIRKIALTKYTRVFSIFTMPSTIKAIANVCCDVKG